MFNLFKRPYSKEDFEDWSKFCYDLAKASATGAFVTGVAGNYTLNQRIFDTVILICITYILALAGRKFRVFANNLKIGG
ncbi:hypothetical protein M3703_04270 [Mannheimia haemolytica]|uniref:hypothetical protein n=1 Tax=Mannheimia haemolytica TaxID=75985 RepID=UPI00201C3AF4|nr:hypothetical protein [Mannheimia haemolytica]UQX68834.1 hypothetical protein M3705_07400 [Mannheimia haemolytica]UQX80538.1 hypothetical protein M3703_04270 [Mannheimia haemolytica]